MPFRHSSGESGRDDWQSRKQNRKDSHFGMTRQCPLAMGPMSMKANTDSVSRSFILHVSVTLYRIRVAAEKAKVWI